MESEKKISAPKRKKTIPTAKKNAAEESILEIPAEKKFELDDFKIDLVGEVKSAAENEIIEPVSAKKKTARKTKQTEVSENVAETEAQPPKKRKTAVKEVSTALQKPANKLLPKTTKKKSATVETISELGEIPKKSRALKKSQTLPQTESSLGLLPKISALETAPLVESETEIVPLEQQSPIFKELAAPKLPNLKPENRARLQMQSPTKIFFYWSLKTNPFETLHKIFGSGADYTLIVKLENKTSGTERIYPIEASGSAWFDVESDSSYRAEVGFFAASRPFIRLLSSNTLETPRNEPSPFFAFEPQFAVSSREFAEVLDVSGYKQDAFEMALAGDDVEASNKATFNAFEHLTGESGAEIKAAELRLALFALASGVSLYDLRDQISTKLFALLEKLVSENAARLSAEKIASALEENFGFGSFEIEENETEVTYSVFGASRINFQKFPKQFWKKFAPNSSLRLSS